jgi:hypothetical protein
LLWSDGVAPIRLLLPLLVLLFALDPGRAHAEDIRRLVAVRVPDKPMPTRTQLKLAGVALGGAAVGLAGAAAVGAVTWYANDCGACDGEDDDFVRGVYSIAASSAAAVLSVPFSSVLFVRGAGRRAGYAGRMGWTNGGAYLGIGIGAGLGFATFVALENNDREPKIGTIVGVGTALGLITVATTTMLFYRLSTRFHLDLVPQVARTTQGGWTSGIAGRF